MTLIVDIAPRLEENTMKNAVFYSIITTGKHTVYLLEVIFI